MNRWIFLPGAVLLFFVMSFKLPDACEKQLHREINKMVNNQSFTLKALPLSDKFRFTGQYFEILTTSGKSVAPKYAYAGRVNTMRSAASTGKPGESADYFDYFIIYDLTGKVIQVRITSYQSSHGQMISSPGWLKKFAGYSANKPLEVGRQVDAISGATISVNNITFDIKQKTHVLAEMIH